MFLALILVPSIGLFFVGGIGEATESIRAVDPSRLSLVQGATVAGVLSAVAWGLGYFGQPHIIVRFMAISSVKETKQARRIGIGWMVISLIGALATALIGIAYYQQNPTESLTDPEAVFIALGQIIFHPFIAGIMLAAVLAAIMSTISSQLIVTSSALIEDLYKIVVKKASTDKEYVTLGRIAVLAVSLIAMFIAWEKSKSILDLVSYAWAGFGAAFGPIILLSLFWRKLTTWGALSGMVVGAITVVIWGNSEYLSGIMYEIVPGFILCLLVATIVSMFTFRHNTEIEREFNEAIELLNREK